MAFQSVRIFRDQFREKAIAAEGKALYDIDTIVTTSQDGTVTETYSAPRFSSWQEARWIGVASIEAFFGWTEHVLIHIAILLGNIRTGEEVANLADSEWSEKVKVAINLSIEPEMKAIYEDLLEVRRQIRNFMAHGAFGKQGEAFRFHSEAGAVPVNLTDYKSRNKFSMWGLPSFKENDALETSERFIAMLWTGRRSIARLYLEQSELPIILTYARDGTYAAAMSSQENMDLFVESLMRAMDRAADMDW